MEKTSKIGAVEFSATTSEEVRYENEVTDRPVEDLGYIADHVKQKPVKFSISGVVTGLDAFSKLTTLRKYCQGKEVYRYFGRNIMSNVVIESFSSSHGKEIQNGFSFTMSCKIVKRAKSQTIAVPVSDPAGEKDSKKMKAQTKKVQNRGKVVDSKKEVDKQKHDKYKMREKRCAAEYATLRKPEKQHRGKQFMMPQ